MNRISILILLTLLAFGSTQLMAQGIAVNEDNSTADASAIMDVKSITKGMLIPRMTTTERTAIGSPAEGLFVYDKTTSTFWFHDGSTWVEQTSEPNDDVNDADASPTNEIQVLSVSGNTVSLSNGGGSVTVNVTDADSDPANEIQVLSSSSSGTNRTIILSNGGGSTTISVADNDNSSSNEIQTLSKSGSTVTLSNGGGSVTDAVNDADASPTNEIQNLSSSSSGTNRTINISGATGTTINVADNDNSSSNEIQTLSKSGSTVTLSNGGGSVTDAVNDADASPTNEIQNLSSSSSGTNRTINISGATGTTINVADNDNSSSNEIQSLSISGNTISLTSGGSVSVPGDNLGNHSATTTLSMNNYNIVNAGSLTINDPGDQEGIIWNGSSAKIFVSPLNSGNSDGYLRLINDGGIVFEPGVEDNESVTFSSNGRVGIGTTSPSEDLHIYRADNDIARVYATGTSQGSGMFFAGQSPTYGGGFSYDGDGTPTLVGGNDRITFFRRNNNTDTDVMSYGYSNSTLRVSSLAGTGNRTVLANASGDLFTEDPNSRVAYGKGGTYTHGSGNDNRATIVSTNSISVNSGDKMHVSVTAASRLTGGSGNDDFYIRIALVSSCGTYYFDETVIRPDEGGSNHDNWKSMAYQRVFSTTCNGSMYARFEVRNTGDDNWQIQDAALVLTRY